MIANMFKMYQFNFTNKTFSKCINELFGKSRVLGTSSVSGSVAGLEGSHALRRVSSMRRAFTSGAAGIKRHSVALQIKFQVIVLFLDCA